MLSCHRADSGIVLSDYFAASISPMDSDLDSGSSTSSSSLDACTSSRSSSTPASPFVNAIDADHSPVPVDATMLPLPMVSTSRSPNRSDISSHASMLIRREAEALMALADRFDLVQQEDTEVEEEQRSTRQSTSFEQTLYILNNLPPGGKVIITGIGKSGLLGRKAAATFCSLGITAVFLDAVAALHGDLGLISPNRLDPVLLVSFSGQTQELINLLPLLRQRCSHLIALTSTYESPIAKASDVWLNAGIGGDGLEADPAVPAPTSSVAVALAIFDAIALCTLRLRVGWHSDGQSRAEAFAVNHPGGAIGQGFSLSKLIEKV